MNSKEKKKKMKEKMFSKKKSLLCSLSGLDIDLVHRMQHNLVLCLSRCSRMTLRSKLIRDEQ